MTKSDRITPRRPNEGITVAQTAVSYGFAELLRSLDACIAAERPLQRGVADIFAPNFDTALAEAEQARDALLASLSTVIDLHEERPSDRALRLMAMALKTLLSIECDEDRVYLADALMQNAQLLEVQGAHPTMRAVRRVQQHFFRSCVVLMSMQDFGGPGPDGDGACGPALAA
ncbi:hypothetical protein CCR83_00055 [Rhodobacter veldkampii DSM 11550]|uniref:Uncharacterized protein n=1 Tax=Phaeovulum veldkampii DSM 11550 TaxID=1185920 RepID=A0A2T4J9B2_9RHOB|nr:hypothetical protein [Phaeovulum veldkampii]MBK5944879.1 hypothetical protein [Phaeovulum veldkampii DSM 11550]PTE14417.1 hypothetical protein C5F46_14920 [Phaeovulum veldkampii DSM 11550]TDQ53184.1 hypothetical protein EV658_1462 [Phaeovulum veldkampii DSM 11550]